MHPDDPLFGAGIDTLAIRAGQSRSAEGEHAEAIYPTSSYVFANAAEAAARFAGDQPGNVYSRYTNPTVRMFEERIAALEGAEEAVATASGMSAILSLAMAHLKSGDHVICSRDVFGTTVNLFGKIMARFGVTTTFVSLADVAAWAAAMRPETRLLFVETPSNPLAEVADLRALADIAHGGGALFAVDNCFCTPALQKPLDFGADIIIHSATKYLDGQGRCLGGVVLGSAALMADVRTFLRTAGPTLSPFNAWVFLKGLETLRLRMDAHCANAQRLAEWLSAHPAVEQVFYAGLPSHPGHAIAWRVIDSTRMLSLTANLGDVKTTIVHPATTTHGRLSDAERADAGITENLIRVSVGLEDIADIQADLARGLALCVTSDV